MPAAVEHEASPWKGRFVLDGTAGDQVLREQIKALQGGKCTKGADGGAGADDYLAFGNGKAVGLFAKIFLELEEDVLPTSFASQKGGTLVSYRVEHWFGGNTCCLMEAENSLLVLNMLGQGE